MNHPELVHGLELLPCAIRDGMLYIPHADGNWVSAAKLQPFSLAIIKCWREEQSRAAPVAQAAAGASDDVLAKLRWVDHVLGEVRQQVAVIESLSYGRACDKLKEVIAALSPRPEADADRASGGGV